MNNYNGLTEDEVKKKLELDGLNILKEKKKPNILNGLGNYYVILLFIVSIFSFFTAYIRKESYFASLVIFIFSIINLYLIYYQTKRDDKKINNNNSIVVIRDGLKKTIKIEELVVGDLVCLESGSYSLIEGKSIDNSNEILIGDYIINSNYYIVSKTGENTELNELLNNKKNSPNDRISIKITFTSLCMIILVIILGLILKYDFLDILVLSLSLLIAIIPEGLILCKSFHLINGNNYYKNNNINIKELNKLETLGKINILILPEKYINKVEEIRSLGIKCIIISDKEINVNTNKINETMLNSLNQDDLLKEIDNYNYFENMSVKSKLKIINLLKEKGYIIGSIGDNITDLYSILLSDISISINDNEDINNISDCIFPNIDIIYQSLAKGQKIVGTIKKSTLYLLAGSIIEGIVVFFSILFNTELFTNIQLLWLNLIVETSLAMLLSYDNSNYKLNNKYNLRIIFKIIFHSLIAIFLFLYYSRVEDILIGSSLLFIYFNINELINILSFEDLEKSILNNKILNNKYLLIGIITIVVVLILVLYSKLSSYLIISGIGFKNIFVILLICLITFIIGELIKPMYKKVFKD